MSESDLFDQYLVDYQPDLKRIIGKHRLPNHALGEDEVLSEINSYLLKKKEYIINYRSEEKNVTVFTHVGFKKAAFSYAKTLIKWTHIRRNNTSYVKINGKPGAGVLTSLSGANGLIEVGENIDNVMVVDIVYFIPFKEALL